MNSVVVICFLFLAVTVYGQERQCGSNGSGCAEDECCAGVLFRRCEKLGTTGKLCGNGYFRCPCKSGYTCQQFLGVGYCRPAGSTTTMMPPTMSPTMPSTMSPPTPAR